MRDSWTALNLGDVIEIQSGFSFKSSDYSDDGHFLIRIGNVQSGHLSLDKPKYVQLDSKTCRFELNAGDILTSLTGNIGRVALVQKEHLPAALNQRVARLTLNGSNVLLREFLYYFLSSGSFRDELNKTAHGVAQKNVSPKAIAGIKISIPPLPEQKRIVAILDEASAGIDTAIGNTEKNLANARELFESYLDAVFTKNDSAWAKVRLETVCEKITVGHVGPMASRYKSEGIPLLRSQNIRPFYVDMNKVVFIDTDFHKELKKSALQPGDLGIVRTGYPGTAAVIPDSLPVANCSDLVIVRPGERVLSDFLALVFNSYYGKKAVAGVLVGAAQKHFNVTAAKAALIPLPAVDEQRRIVAECSDLREEHQRLESIYQQKLTALAELKQALLEKAFSGELTAARAAPQSTLKEEEVA